ncbi:hypothetical protein [Mesorhizobium sp. L-8-10]|uniref:hypothetical protein n=1 Tax=Mesorhizobium sp. L-8-10 TaxID=2744523 RepID=UPI00192614E4|nr:hypothetical protein [Mesorhizobium sp. L-8-10]
MTRSVTVSGRAQGEWLRGSGADGLSAETIAALAAHPRFDEAIRLVAAGMVRLHRGNRLVSTLVSDRGRFVIGYLCVYLHYFGDDGHGPGLTTSRMRALCVEQKLCSGNRAEAVLALMRLAGYLAAAPASADRRMRLLVPTDRLLSSLRERWANQFEAMRRVLPEGDRALAALGRPEFTPAFVRHLSIRFFAGFRLLDQAPDLELFMERNAGIVVLLHLALTGAQSGPFPPEGPIPVSISAIAARFGVSRSHVRKLLRDAGDAGLIHRPDADGSHIGLSPRLVKAVRVFLAAALLFLAHCAAAAIDEIDAV